MLKRSYDPREAIEAYRAQFGELGRLVLKAFNEVDPYGCRPDDESNPDEYLSYARRVCEAMTLDPQERELESLLPMVEASFGKEQLVEEAEYLTAKKVEDIAHRIQGGLIGYRLRTGVTL